MARTTAGSAALPAAGPRDVRRHILDTALDLVEADGILALTQPKVAKAAGLRQSHITYYFPRKADLVVALLEASHGRAAAAPDGKPGPDGIVSGLMFDRDRMLFFLGILLAAANEPELRAVVRGHMEAFAGEVAASFGTAPDAPPLLAFLDEVRGLALRRLVAEEGGAGPVEDVAAIARRHGLGRLAAGRLKG